MKEKVKRLLDKIKLKCVTDKRKVILGVVSSFVIISMIGFSYALFSVSVEQSNTFTIVVGELTYILKSDKLNSNREITVSPNEIQVLKFEITSQMEFGTLYQIYYEGTNDNNVKVSYYKNDYYSGIGTIDAKGTVNIQVVINNRSNDPVTIKFGVQGGLLDRTLTLNQGLGLNEYETGDIVITYSYEGDGITPNGFPKKGDGYKVKSVDCDSGTAVWDLNTWSLDVSLITSTGSICNVVFEDSSIYVDPSNANEPELIDGLIPVVYDESTSNWVKADTNTAWYDYGSQVWANAVTVTEASRASYMSASAGTTISMNDINTMWVWIPRYEYMYTNLGTQYAGGTQAVPGEIKVNFISKNTILPSDATNYKVHPGFIFGNQQLSGFWFAKFETSSSNATVANYGGGNNTALDVRIVPLAISWRNINYANMFTVSRKLTAAGNIYGLSSASDSHTSKDSEWGAVAYLTQSKYGKYGNNNYSGSNKEVYMNNYGENTYFTALTGCSSGSPPSNYYGASCTYTYDKNISGTGASTTGTIYGVYDMVGGDWEGTMGNFGNVINASGFLSMPESKYYDLYTDSNTETACGGVICYGLAASETIRWYADRASFPTSGNSWSLRGGSYNNGSDSGIFSFHPVSGTANLGNTFRVSLTP